MQVSSDNVSYSTKRTITVTAEGQSFKDRIPDTSDVKYFRIIRTGDTGDLGSLKISVSEFNVLFASTSASNQKHLILVLNQIDII